MIYELSLDSQTLISYMLKKKHRKINSIMKYIYIDVYICIDIKKAPLKPKQKNKPIQNPLINLIILFGVGKKGINFG